VRVPHHLIGGCILAETDQLGRSDFFAQSSVL
jgi:hypothetical protein